MGSFGKYLLEKGVLSREALEEATEALVIVGGRLGTNLLELGLMGVDDLDRHLAEHLGCETPPPEWLERPSPEALNALSPKLTRRHAILPLALADGHLHVALSDPSGRALLEKLRLGGGHPVKPYLISEVHLAALRAKHLRIRPERRFEQLSLDWLHRSQERLRRKHKGLAVAASPEAEAAQRHREAFGVAALDEGEELTDDQSFSSLHQRWLPGAADGPTPAAAAPIEISELEEVAPGPSEVARLEAELAETPDRDAVTDLALRLARAYSGAAAFFVIHRGVIRGLAARGPTVGERIEGVVLPLEMKSVFAETARNGTPFRGAPPGGGIDEAVLKALGRGEAAELLVLPIRIHDRVVNLLYADNGPDRLGETSVGALSALCASVAAAYERLILARRRSHF